MMQNTKNIEKKPCEVVCVDVMGEDPIDVHNRIQRYLVEFNRSDANKGKQRLLRYTPDKNS